MRGSPGSLGGTFRDEEWSERFGKFPRVFMSEMGCERVVDKVTAGHFQHFQKNNLMERE